MSRAESLAWERALSDVATSSAAARAAAGRLTTPSLPRLGNREPERKARVAETMAKYKDGSHRRAAWLRATTLAGRRARSLAIRALRYWRFSAHCRRNVRLAAVAQAASAKRSRNVAALWRARGVCAAPVAPARKPSASPVRRPARPPHRRHDALGYGVARAPAPAPKPPSRFSLLALREFTARAREMITGVSAPKIDPGRVALRG